jgi:hypothetical protein
MSAMGLGRFKTVRQKRFKLRETVNEPLFDFRLCSDRGHQRLNAHNIHHAGEIVGEHVQRHLGSDLGQTFHQEVGRPILIFNVPKGCSAVSRRWRMACGLSLS